MRFKESRLAHEYCIGKGIELGAASHNPFGLEDCKNIAPSRDEDFFGNHQVEICGEKAKIDIYGTADIIPIETNSLDYVISSHVIEHVPDLIGSFLEWNRVLKDKGIIFIIVPKRNALPTDEGRPLSDIKQFMDAHKNENKGAVNTDDHIWVFSLESLVCMIHYCNDTFDLGWEILEQRETDDKVGNGHCVVCRRK